MLPPLTAIPPTLPLLAVIFSTAPLSRVSVYWWEIGLGPWQMITACSLRKEDTGLRKESRDAHLVTQTGYHTHQNHPHKREGNRKGLHHRLHHQEGVQMVLRHTSSFPLLEDQQRSGTDNGVHRRLCSAPRPLKVAACAATHPGKQWRTVLPRLALAEPLPGFWKVLSLKGVNISHLHRNASSLSPSDNNALQACRPWLRRTISRPLLPRHQDGLFLKAHL